MKAPQSSRAATPNEGIEIAIIASKAAMSVSALKCTERYAPLGKLLKPRRKLMQASRTNVIRSRRFTHQRIDDGA